MRIGITGDTHGSVRAIRQLVQHMPPLDLWLHTGDHAGDANLLEAYSGLKVIRVVGNCDFGSKEALPDEFLELAGHRLWLTHGHKYIERYEKADIGYWAGQYGVEVAIYGHTHVPLVDNYGEILLVNPGSPSRPRSSFGPSFAVLELKEGQKPQAELFQL